VSEAEVEDMSVKELLRKSIPRIFRATVVAAIVGACLLFSWLLFSAPLVRLYPESQLLFTIFTWAIVFFTFSIRVTDGTILKYCFIIGRAFFLAMYIIYATNGGILEIDFMNFHFSIGFIPILSLMVLLSLLAMAKGVLQAIEFTSESPKD